MKTYRRCLVMTMVLVFVAAAAEAGIEERRGKVTFLRVHDVGSKFGPAADQIDVEVVVRLDSRPDEAYGFQLRNDAQGPARAGMLDLLRDAFRANTNVVLDVNIDSGHKHGTILRVALTK